jgi:opacity protein-like surface antigen
MKISRFLIFLVVVSCAYNLHVSGQDLESLLEDQMSETTEFTSATFKATRILNGHSIERTQEGQLDFRISHRFGKINSGAYEFFGLDQAHIHLGLEYGIKDWIMVGIGRGTFEKTVDGFTKFSLLRQSSGVRNMPVSISFMSGIYVNGLHKSDPDMDNYFRHRLAFAQQLMIARKFNPSISLQLTPSYLHRNLMETSNDQKDIFALGAGSRIKLSKRISFNAEYFYLFIPDNETLDTEIFNPLSLGIDIETGGHVFQIILTNSVGMTENAFLGHTTGRWLDGDIHIGFNISRMFQLKKL